MPHHVLALLNRPSLAAGAHVDGAAVATIVDPDAPQLSALDLGATRGDGIFETISVGHGRPQALDHHLRRFASSAAKLDLPAPDLDAWREAILLVVDALGAGDLGMSEEAWVKTVLTRGIEGDGRPTGWVYGAHSADFTAVRRDGVRVISLDRGYRHDVEQTSPWLLAGAKTLSYAVNRAVAREAARRDADDVIFVSSDGYVLEGPTSTVIYRRGDTLLTPGTGLGILDGTTQANVFRFAEERGMSTGFELLGIDELAAADAIWLASSVRLLVPVRALNGVQRAVDGDFGTAVNSWLKALHS